IGPPGTTVLTTELEQFAQSLDVVQEELGECSRRLARTDLIVTDFQLLSLDAPYSAVRAEQAQEQARGAIAEALASSESLTTGLRKVVEAYTRTELQLTEACARLNGLLGYGFGWMLPSLALLAVPVLVPNLVGSAVGFLMLSE